MNNFLQYTTPLTAIPKKSTQALQDFFTTLPHQVSLIDPAVAVSVRQVENFIITGGKRIRPLFVWAGLRAVWESPQYHSQLSRNVAELEPPTAYLNAASSIEFIQACALMHDDIIDDSATRRGFATTHKKFESIHREQSWRGDSSVYGRNQAILAGDLALTWADDLLNFSGLESRTLAQSRIPWSAMKSEVVAGQILDITLENSGQSTAYLSEKINRYKTAAYTVERPLHLGAALAGGTEKIQQILRTWGTHIGLAFQLQDDVLGVYGEPSITGKPSGDDLISGKQTFLINSALELAGEEDSAERKDLYSRLHNAQSSEDIAYLRDHIQHTGALTLVENKIKELTNTANEELQSANLGKGITEELTEISEKLIGRTY